MQCLYDYYLALHRMKILLLDKVILLVLGTTTRTRLFFQLVSLLLFFPVLKSWPMSLLKAFYCCWMEQVKGLLKDGEDKFIVWKMLRFMYYLMLHLLSNMWETYVLEEGKSYKGCFLVLVWGLWYLPQTFPWLNYLWWLVNGLSTPFCFNPKH